MHTSELVQLAATVALHARRIVQSRARFPDAALELYWSASKCRHERWARTLKTLAAFTSQTSGSPVPSVGTACNPLLDEVLTTEILTRVWAAVCLAIDRVRGE